MACRYCQGGGSSKGPDRSWQLTRLGDETVACRCVSCGTWWRAWKTHEEITRYRWEWEPLAPSRIAEARECFAAQQTTS